MSEVTLDRIAAAMESIAASLAKLASPPVMIAPDELTDEHFKQGPTRRYENWTGRRVDQFPG